MPRFQGKCVLIIDDEFAVVEALTELLAWEGAAVLSAPNGAEGLQVMEVGRPDWVVVDFMMPVMNGVEFCKAVRKIEWAGAIPIVMISAAPAPAVQGKVPWNVFLRKPFEIEALYRALEEARQPPRPAR